MSQVNGKYLKDEQGNIFSPIVSVDSVYWEVIEIDGVR